jgi:hypothetical protein
MLREETPNVALPPKICPECGEEYLHSAQRCVHCDVALEHAERLETRAPDELPPIAELHCIRAASSSWAMGLSEELSAAGIAHRVEAVGGEQSAEVRRPGREHPCGVYVRVQDVAAAERIDARFFASQMPDLPEGFDSSTAAPDDACPACGDPLAPEAAECPGCGLVLASSS